MTTARFSVFSIADEVLQPFNLEKKLELGQTGKCLSSSYKYIFLTSYKRIYISSVAL